MASSLESLYQQVILDHAREKHGQGLRDPQPGAGPQIARTGQSRQYNPLCGDEVTLRVAVSEVAASDVAASDRAASDGALSDRAASGQPPMRMITDLSWTGEGCSISQAATSVLHDLVVGHPVEEAIEIVGTYREMLRGRGEVEPDEAVLGDAVAFAGVGRHANRVKCAILGWTAFEDALLRTGTGPEGEIR